MPVIETDESNLTEDEALIYNILKDEVELSRGELDRELGFNKSKTLRVINKLNYSKTSMSSTYKEINTSEDQINADKMNNIKTTRGYKKRLHSMSLLEYRTHAV